MYVTVNLSRELYYFNSFNKTPGKLFFMDLDHQKISKLDQELIEATKKIKVLSALAWPADSENIFLKGWHKGNPTLPQVQVEKQDLSSSVKSLDAISEQCDRQHPIEKFLANTAESYADAARMLMAAGTKDFTKYSSRIYGRPDMVYKLQGMTAVDAANFFLELTDDLLGNASFPTSEATISATEFAEWLEAEVDEFFQHDVVQVKLDPNIASKALAGATRIRLRGSAEFSSLDKDQLLYHEAYVHTATLLNGKKQTNLKSFGLGAPRTTRTQEGLAVFAELVTNAMDIDRLRRIVLRVIAVKMALDGADFIDLFKFFLNAGQPEIESVRSAQRIFRSGDVKGGIVFTKDAVYLQGLLEVHTFLRIAIRDNHPEMVNDLFAGRLTLGDAVQLQPFFESGWLDHPIYMPPWASDLRRLTALMAYSAFISKVKLEKVSLNRFVEFEDELHNFLYKIK
jgi:uncharacterized protein (TIGR02421 family)